MESDGRNMMENNYAYSRRLLDWCQEEEVPLIYASSASVYGAGPDFREERSYEKPLNVYGYSKFLFDQYVRSISRTAMSVSNSTAPSPTYHWSISCKARARACTRLHLTSTRRRATMLR